MAGNTLPPGPITPQTTTPSIPMQIIDHTISTAKAMGISYALSTAIGAPLEYFGAVERATRLNGAAFAAFATPIGPRVSLFYQKLLGCNENTPIRKITSDIASTFTSIAVTGAVCNELGYNVNTMDIINAQITGFKYAAYAAGACLATLLIANRCFGVSLDDEDIQEGQEFEELSDTQREIKPLNETAALKTERIKQAVLYRA